MSDPVGLAPAFSDADLAERVSALAKDIAQLRKDVVYRVELGIVLEERRVAARVRRLLGLLNGFGPGLALGVVLGAGVVVVPLRMLGLL